MPVLYLIVGMLLLIGADQWTKYLVSTNISEGSVNTLIPGILSITNLHNNGAAWSILEGQQWLFTLISIFAIVLVSYFMYKLRTKKLYEFSLLILLSGIIGNFIDRLFQGYVVDMIQLDFINFPIFNFADSCITVGIIILFIAILRDGDLD
ncbi:signal peptidase II [Apilactobacillus apisilvae]|uniref:Lipoprotein signal peptidase n=1 Tax=Apilactobacillus apisilvae TaxID=2923364 RepID=A0ABY4PHQ3_9LACO|nr:signal peptidase II [Apilactobacillus apisilvae]UQS85370.1 signal peptidase II [Apilactobacillus apisilvae]